MRQKDSLKNYELYDIIGKGAFGDVRIAKNKTTSILIFLLQMKSLPLNEYKNRDQWRKNKFPVYIWKDS